MVGYLAFPMLIAGIIIGAVHPALFNGVYSLSTVLIVVGAILMALQVIIGAIAASAAKKAFDTRRRRGF